MKKFRVTVNTAYLLFSVMLAVAQVKKDLRTHAEHEEHNPCDCNKQCIRCAF
jgi:hypothetical protein